MKFPGVSAKVSGAILAGVMFFIISNPIVYKLVDGVLRDIKHLLLLPVSTITDSLPVLARRLGRERGKAVELSVRGGEVELDKRVLDELKDPLLHLVRNAVDHGVEPADDRVRRQKPAAATVTITIRTLDGTKAEIVVADDGGGNVDDFHVCRPT